MLAVVRLTDQELQFLAAALDCLLKSQGLRAVAETAAMVAKLESAASAAAADRARVAERQRLPRDETVNGAGECAESA